MHVTRQTTAIAGVVALSAFYIGRMTGLPAGPQTFDECARHVSRHGATQDTLSAAYAACVTRLGPNSR